jgi:hypothetical protein
MPPTPIEEVRDRRGRPVRPVPSELGRRAELEKPAVPGRGRIQESERAEDDVEHALSSGHASGSARFGFTPHILAELRVETSPAQALSVSACGERRAQAGAHCTQVWPYWRAGARAPQARISCAKTPLFGRQQKLWPVESNRQGRPTTANDPTAVNAFPLPFLTLARVARVVPRNLLPHAKGGLRCPRDRSIPLPCGTPAGMSRKCPTCAVRFSDGRAKKGGNSRFPAFLSRQRGTSAPGLSLTLPPANLSGSKF